jgi:hypothetical protein
MSRICKHLYICSEGTYNASPVPDFASIDNNTASILLTAMISGNPVLEPPNRRAFHNSLFNL